MLRDGVCVLRDDFRVFGAGFADCLAAERFFVTHVTVDAKFAKRGGDHRLERLMLPDGTHHERRHQHVATEVRGVSWQPGHQLFTRHQQFDAAHLSLHPSRANRQRVRGRNRCTVCRRGIEKGQKRGRENLLSRQWCQRL